MRAVALLIAACALLTFGWLFFWPTQVQSLAPVIGEPVQEKASTAASPVNVPREPAQPSAESKVDQPLEQKAALLLLLVDGTTGTPIPEHDFWFLPWRLTPEQGRQGLFESRNPTVRSDAEGLARITHPSRFLTFFARKDHLVGFLSVDREILNAGAPNALRFELHPELSLTIRALNQQGVAMPGVGISGALLGGLKVLGRKRHLGSTSDPAGTLTWNDLGLMLQSSKHGGRPITGIRLHAHVAGASDIVKELSPVPASGSTIDLQLPPIGSLTVHFLDPRRQPILGKSPVVLRGLNIDPLTGETQRITSESRWTLDGVAIFPTVALDQFFEVTIEDLNSVMPRIEISGPTSEEPNVTRELVLGSNLALLRGRAIDALGEPLANQRLSRSFQLDAVSMNDFVWTGPDGSFLMPLSELETNTKLDAAEFVSSKFPAIVDLHERSPFAPGITELGDLIFAEQPLLLSGRIISAVSDPNCAYTALSVEHRASVDEPWRRQSASIVRGDDDFKVLASPSPGDYRLLVQPRRRCAVPPEPIFFAPGQTGLVVRLEEGHRLTVHMSSDTVEQLHPLSQFYKLVLRQQPGVTGTADPFGKTEKMPPTGQGIGDDKLPEFSWQGLTAGFYTLEAWNPGGEAPFHVSRNLAVPGPDQTIDLGENIRKFTLRLIYPETNAERKQARAFFLSEGELAGPTFNGHAEIRLTTIPGAYDVLVLAVGFEPVLLKQLDQDMDIAMHASQSRFEVRLGQALALPDDVGLRVKIASTGEPHPGWQVPEQINKPASSSGSGGLHRQLNNAWPDRASALFDKQGRAELQLHRMGPQTIAIELIPRTNVLRAQWGRASIPIPGISPARRDLQASPELQILQISIPAAVLEAALQKAGVR